VTEDAICFRTEKTFARLHDPRGCCRVSTSIRSRTLPSYLQLLLEERFAMAYPEQTAAMLRAAFRD